LGILVGGGPAPGINGVIASATIEALNSGLEVVGLFDGYEHLARGDASKTLPLTLDLVSRIHATGGSILRTSRTNPAKDEATLGRTLAAIEALNLRYLIAIGGDDTSTGAARISERTGAGFGIATVPKTIDNDLPLPDNAPTFGFETARSVGAAIVENLMEDARTASRWYLAVTMGRKSGSLALGICKASGATLAIVPEEFPDGEIRLADVVDTVAGAIVKRLASGRDHGVAVIAEGFVERLPPNELEAMAEASRDAYGNVRLAEIPIGTALRDAVRERLRELGLSTTVVPKDIGYELRCAKPVPFDVEYTRTLGYGAVRYLLKGGSGALIALSGGHVVPVNLTDLMDAATGHVRTRRVDVTSESYLVAREYMIRLEASDFSEPQLSKLSSKTKLSSADFAAQFGRLV
ncbi:MAG: 6-phosphofructokinase, partial [Candidatus Eremiobacteraeota bacterium]|nr:6-phosphofructokinase [Candidatus Eremiobacteraeota bacterium]